MDSKKKQKPDTDNLSIYDLPTLNAVIDQFEQPQSKGGDQGVESETTAGK